jgi:predicted nucleotidyltransferase
VGAGCRRGAGELSGVGFRGFVGFCAGVIFTLSEERRGLVVSGRLSMLPEDAQQHLAAFKQEVEKALPGRVARVTLFGSRARGDAEEDSDYDVAVFVRHLGDHRPAQDAVSDAAYPHKLEGVLISAIVLPEEYMAEESPTELAAEIARDGIVLP